MVGANEHGNLREGIDGGEVMDSTARLDAMEAAIKKPSFRQSSGKANEVNYWIFDYPPEKELEVRERIEYMKNKNLKGTDEYNWLFSTSTTLSLTFWSARIL